MTSTNLTRTEAVARAALITVEHYDISLDLSDNCGASDSPHRTATFPSTTTVTFTAREAGDTFIDLRATAIESATLDGTDIIPAGDYDEEHGLALTGLTAGPHELTVTAQCVYSRSGQGLHRFVDPADDETYLYTQFETADAKRMFACFDQPDMKATYALSITVPEHWTVISNAAQQVSEPENGTRTHTSTIDYQLSTYLVAVCAGPYHEVRDQWDGELTHHPETPEDQPTGLSVPLGLYCRQSLAQYLDSDRLFTETKQGFDFYHRNFGVAYPFNKYDQVFCPEYNMGAMENAGCVTIRDEYVFSSKATHYRYERRADTVLHELAHMWFGDLVTMRWWDDLWLNESFATWSAAISQAEETAYDTAWVTFANVEKAWAYQQDQLPSTHPVSTDASDLETVEQNFDGITYAKGASVLKQLQAYVGRENFFAGVRRHFAAHRWSNATFEDLLKALEAASGRDLSDWAGQWLKTTGISQLSPDFAVTDGHYSSFAVTQGGDVRTHRIAVGLYSLSDATVTRTQRVELDVTGPRTEVPELVGAPAADLVLVNDDDLTYCLMGLDEASKDFLLAHIAEISDPMARTLCWSAAWEMTRAGQLPAREFVALVARGAQAETQLAVLEKILAQAATAVSRYADPQWAHTTGRNLLANALLDGAQNAEPEAALIFARQLAAVELNDAAAEFLTGQLDSTDSDNEQRWLALTALVSHGYVGADEVDGRIATLREQDPSSTGAQSALRVQAARPDAQAKRQAFDAAVGTELSNLESRFTLEGLTWPGSDELLAEFNEEFFAVVTRVWNDQVSEIAQRTINALYPYWDVSEEGLERAERFLASTPSAGLARLIVENKDRVARALRLRAIDAQAS